jgi:hypothetical protein
MNSEACGEMRHALFILVAGGHPRRAKGSYAIARISIRLSPTQS